MRTLLQGPAVSLFQRFHCIDKPPPTRVYLVIHETALGIYLELSRVLLDKHALGAACSWAAIQNQG